MGVIIFNGISSRDFHIQVEHPPGYTFPERDYDVYHVPGKNGDVLVDKGSFKNYDMPYDISIGSFSKNFDELMANISAWLLSSPGYARLEDSYSPDFYRMAMYVGPMNMENLFNQAGRGQVIFNCQPQKYLKLGDKVVRFTKAGTLRNPTIHTAKPIITVRGSGAGVLKVGDCEISISSIGELDHLQDSKADNILDSSNRAIDSSLSASITINSEIEDIYSGSTNRNGVVSLPNRTYPKLYAGGTSISFSGGITAVEVIPRWWTV